MVHFRYVFVFCLAFTLIACNKSSNDSQNSVFSDYNITSAHINVNEKKGNYHQENLTSLTTSEIKLFKEWFENNKEKGMSYKGAPLGDYPYWCFVFNKDDPKTAIVFCRRYNASGLFLVPTLYIKQGIQYPLTTEDINFFKNNFTALKNIN